MTVLELIQSVVALPSPHQGGLMVPKYKFGGLLGRYGTYQELVSALVQGCGV